MLKTIIMQGGRRESVSVKYYQYSNISLISQGLMKLEREGLQYQLAIALRLVKTSRGFPLEQAFYIGI